MSDVPEITAAGELPRELSARYDNVEIIGTGGTSVVHKAWDKELRRTIALKVLHRGLTGTSAVAQRFRREAQLLSSLHHPGIVELYHYDCQGGLAYCAMEYVPGTTLDRIAKNGGLPPRRSVEIIAEVAEALSVVHRQGIVHRDLKPANIVLTAAGKPKLLDFGFGKADSNLTPLTRSTQLVGTPLYLPPEVCLGDEADQRSDIYQLGLVLFELLTGHRPFQPATMDELFDMILGRTDGDIPRPSALVQTVGADIDALVAAMLERQPERRLATAAEVARSCRRWLAKSRRRQAAKPAGRSMATYAAIVVLLVVAALLREYHSLAASSPGAPTSSVTSSFACSASLRSQDELVISYTAAATHGLRLELLAIDEDSVVATWDLDCPPARARADEMGQLACRLDPPVTKRARLRITPLTADGRPRLGSARLVTVLPCRQVR